MEWDEEKAKEIVKKHKSRFSLRLTLKIIRIVFVLFILYTIYMVVVSVLYDKSKVGERTTYYQQLAIDWTYPALTTDFGHNSENEITPFFTQKINLSLMRTIGKESYPVTKLHLKKPLLTMFTQTKIDGYDQFHLSNDNRFSFYLPYHP